MEILYLIGNGFDINAGLDTSARELIKEYKQTLDSRLANDANTPKELKRIQKSIEANIENWSSFEKKLGEFTKETEDENSPEKVFNCCFDDFRDFLGNKIKKENDRIGFAIISSTILSSFKKGVLSFLGDGLRPKEKQIFNGLITSNEHWNINFISFNYTTLLNKLIKETNEDQKVAKQTQIGPFKYNRNLHMPVNIHGIINDGNGIIVGMDSSSQIVGETCRASNSLCQKFIKPIVNQRMEMLREVEAANLIKKANIICIFGMSLGETDSTWWKAIANRITIPNNNNLLIINQLEERNSLYAPEEIPNKKDEIKDRFCSLALIKNEKNIQTLKDRTLISFGSKAFNLNYNIPKTISEKKSAS